MMFTFFNGNTLGRRLEWQERCLQRHDLYQLKPLRVTFFDVHFAVNCSSYSVSVPGHDLHVLLLAGSRATGQDTGTTGSAGGIDPAAAFWSGLL